MPSGNSHYDFEIEHRNSGRSSHFNFPMLNDLVKGNKRHTFNFFMGHGSQKVWRNIGITKLMMPIAASGDKYGHTVIFTVLGGGHTNDIGNSEWRV